MPPQPNRLAEALAGQGYLQYEADARIAAWAAAALAAAEPVIASDEARQAWLRCEGTWFAGVDVLPNASDGSVSDIPLEGRALEDLGAIGLSPGHWHAGQVSVTYPGYPRPKEGESAGAARYRMQRDAAHVDGLLPIGPARRRMLREPHMFILGIALNDAEARAAPLVLWPGSHRVMGAAFATAREAGMAVAAEGVDLTEAYVSARREVFASLPRVPVPLRPGEAIVLHRHMLHGIAPWTAPARENGRKVAYFRPQMAQSEAWFA